MQIAAIESSEKKETSEISQLEKANRIQAWISGATSFEELDAFEQNAEIAEEAEELVGAFGEMANNVLRMPAEQGEKISKFESLADGLKTRLKNLFSSGGEMEDKSSEPVDGTGILFWKDQSGDYRWVAKYSNNFRDDDRPAEIISEKSHHDFASRVEKEQAELPELYIWHEKSLAIGQADWVAVDEIHDGIVYALAGGRVPKEHADVVEFISALPPESIGVSHGMPASSIVRDENDPTVIVRHDTKEISVLPKWAAANKYTAFAILKEESMSIPKEKREKIVGWGLSENVLSKLEAANSVEARKAAEVTEFKETADTLPANVEMTEEVEAEESGVEAAETGETETEVVEESPTPEEKQASTVTMEAVAEVMQSALKEINTAWQERFDALEARLAEKEVAEKQAEAELKQLPTASLGARIAMSIIGRPEAQVDGRSSLAKQGPTETKSNESGPTSLSFINAILDGD